MSFLLILIIRTLYLNLDPHFQCQSGISMILKSTFDVFSFFLQQTFLFINCVQWQNRYLQEIIMPDSHLSTDKHPTVLKSFWTIFGKTSNPYILLVDFVNIRVVNEAFVGFCCFFAADVLVRKRKDSKAILIKVEVKGCLPVNCKAERAKTVSNSDHSQAN